MRGGPYKILFKSTMAFSLRPKVKELYPAYRFGGPLRLGFTQRRAGDCQPRALLSNIPTTLWHG